MDRIDIPVTIDKVGNPLVHCASMTTATISGVKRPPDAYKVIIADSGTDAQEQMNVAANDGFRFVQCVPIEEKGQVCIIMENAFLALRKKTQP